MINKKRIKKIFCAVLLTSVQYYAVADTSKSQLLSSMSGNPTPNSSAPGGLVSNNVTYGQGQNTTFQNNNVSSNNQNGNQNINLLNDNQNNNAKSKKVVKKKTTKKTVVKKVDVSNQKIDITYFGDVSGVPNLISQYFPGMTVGSSLGKKTDQSVSFDMQGVTIEDISSMIQSLTGGSARLIYNQYQNSIRVSYVSTQQTSKLSTEQQSKNWRDGKGKPQPIMTDSGVLLFPYGQYEPTVICKPQQVCDIQFEAGENIIDAVMGDTNRWIVQGVVSGKGANSVKHIVLKPQYPDLNTNMIVTTDKGRTYNLKLVSSDRNYVTAVSWYYPQDINNKMMLDFNKQQRDLGNSGSNPNSSGNYSASGYTNPGLNSTANGIQVKGTPSNDGSDELAALDLDFRYKISGDKVIWKPLRVFNDGVHTFIEVSPKALNIPAPAFMVYEPYSGNYEMVNYRQKGNYFIVDQVFKEGVLIYDVGSNQQKVSISHIEDTTKDNRNWLY